MLIKSAEEIRGIAVSTISNEVSAISALKNAINEDFVSSVERIIGSDGRVVITGIGKSANIAQKIVSTLNSTGTPSIFMHAADAVHGDARDPGRRGHRILRARTRRRSAARPRMV